MPTLKTFMSKDIGAASLRIACAGKLDDRVSVVGVLVVRCRNNQRWTRCGETQEHVDVELRENAGKHLGHLDSSSTLHLLTKAAGRTARARKAHPFVESRLEQDRVAAVGMSKNPHTGDIDGCDARENRQRGLGASSTLRINVSPRRRR